jgi:hypothetical protein
MILLSSAAAAAILHNNSSKSIWWVASWLSALLWWMMSFPFFSSLTSSGLSDYSFNVIDWFGWPAPPLSTWVLETSSSHGLFLHVWPEVWDSQPQQEWQQWSNKGLFPLGHSDHTFCPHNNRFSITFVGLALVGKDIVFRFIIEYISSLRDFLPLVDNRSIFIWGFSKDDILAWD